MTRTLEALGEVRGQKAYVHIIHYYSSEVPLTLQRE
jgi:hypothetical protein